MGVWWANGPAGFEASQFQAPTGSQNEGNERGNETLSSENGDVAGARMKGSRAVPKTTAMSDTTCRFEGPLDAPEFL